MVGVDDSARGRSAAVTFLVYGDGKLLARSRPMRLGQAPVPLTAAISGVRLIEIIARSTGARGQSFPVVWGDAALTR